MFKFKFHTRCNIVAYFSIHSKYTESWHWIRIWTKFFSRLFRCRLSQFNWRSKILWEFFFFFASDFVSWYFKRQNTIALLSCEFEYYAFVETNKKIVWFRQFFVKLNCMTDSKSNLIYANNQKTIALFENFEHYKRTKHIVNKWYWIRQTIEKQIIQMKYVSIVFMIANDLTKFLNSNVFQMFLKFINMIYWSFILQTLSFFCSFTRKK